jgi:hypothetical protein
MELYPYTPYMTSRCGQDKLQLFTLNTLKNGGSKEVNTKGRKKETRKKIEEEGNKEGKIRRERSRK